MEETTKRKTGTEKAQERAIDLAQGVEESCAELLALCARRDKGWMDKKTCVAIVSSLNEAIAYASKVCGWMDVVVSNGRESDNREGDGRGDDRANEDEGEGT